MLLQDSELKVEEMAKLNLQLSKATARVGSAQQRLAKANSENEKVKAEALLQAAQVWLCRYVCDP